MSAEQLFADFPFGFRTIHATLFHIVEVFQTWTGCVGPTIAKPPKVLYDRNIPLDHLADWSTNVSREFLRAVEASHAAGLLSDGRRIEQVFHLVTHGTHHRTQIITMLRLLGKGPPYEAGDFGGWSNGR